MTLNKGWIDLINDRLNDKYKLGIQEFLDYAFRKTCEGEHVPCPCVKCKNACYGSREMLGMHLLVYGMMQNYKTWYYHGESMNEESKTSDCDDIEELLRDLYLGMMADLDRSGGSEIGSSSQNKREEEPNDEAKAFYNLLNNSKEPTYPGRETSKLDSVVNLLKMKSIGRWSNESFDMLLKFLKRILPTGSVLPESYYEAKKIVKGLGLSYQKIDACVNHCMLYWKEDIDSDECKICGASRWVTDNHNGETKVRANGKKVAMKTLRYFPLKPRLQRLFMSKKTAPLMVWHHDKRVDDGVLRHPADTMAWKSLDDRFKDIAVEPRNVRLGLASDGFQPFTHSKTSYIIWPVMLIPYNVPPWMCMKESNFIISMLIPGPEGPGDAIDVYLQPLIEELNELWKVGTETFDASTCENFKLRAALLWTINDFPAYGNLSGWSTKGKMACPRCNKDSSSMRLVNGHKQCYMCHRRFLHMDHIWRKNKSLFDGTKEMRPPPRLLSGAKLRDQAKDLGGIVLTKDPRRKVKISHEKRGDNWNKDSIFNKLPYWPFLLLPYNLDVMHIEKNIFDNVNGTIMNINGKTKDNVQSRLDLELMNIRPELHPLRKGDKLELPAAAYTLSKEEKHLFCLFFKQLRVSDGFSANISQSVNMKEHKFSGLKIHDCHVMLQHLLPLGIRGLLPKAVCEPLIELSLFFTSLGAKSLRVDELERIESQIPITLCKLEQVFVPSFFDVMVHLSVHLASEAKIGGPVQYRWMYPIERMLYKLKKLIRNMARPEGSIAEGYIASECMTFCSRYLNGFKSKFSTFDRNSDGGFDKIEGELSVFTECGCELGSGMPRNLNDDEWEKAQTYILNNCDEVQPFLEEYSQIQEINTPQVSNDEWNRNFIVWFRKKVEKMGMEDQNSKSAKLISLARGPSYSVMCFNGYAINGYRFRTEARDTKCRTQNSGVCVLGDIGTVFGVMVDAFVSSSWENWSCGL